MRLDIDSEYGVRSRRFGVHVGCSGCSVAESDLHVFLHVLDVVDFELDQVFDVYSLLGALLQIHLRFRILAQQVVDLLVVNFDKAAPDQMSLRGVTLGDGHDLTEGSWDYTFSFFSA